MFVFIVSQPFFPADEPLCFSGKAANYSVPPPAGPDCTE